jgi:predicted dehydrogenase
MLSQTLGEQLGIWIQTKSSMFRVLRPSALSASATTGSIRPKRPKSDSDTNTFQMTQKEIRVGIVGASPNKSWAVVSHVPAINDLPGLKLAAVATSNKQSAREAAEAFGADRWFSDPLTMIRDDRIDLITISVRVPAHRELVLAALEAGKPVYCEAPLGRTVAEAEEMARAAGSLHTAIGLQGRLNPAVRRAAQLISSGKIGRPLNARIVSTNIGFGPELPSSYDYFNKTSSGANLLTINGGHALDLVEAVLGPIIEIDARTEILWPAVKLTDTGEESMRETADHFAVLGKTQSGAVFTAEIYGGVAPQDTRSSFEIRGSEAWLSLTSDHPFGIHAGDHAEIEHSVRDTRRARGLWWLHGHGDQRGRGLRSSGA